MTNDEQEALTKIADAAELLGWQIAFPTGEDVNYIILARPDVIDEVTARLED